MDANSNKVQTLRQQFEQKNYEKAEQVENATGLTLNKYPSSILRSPTKNSNKSAELIDHRPSSTNLKNDILEVAANLTNNSPIVVEDVRRNGIYVSNSITLSSTDFQQQHQSNEQRQNQASAKTSPACIIPPSLKRRPMVLDLHQCDNDGFIDEMEDCHPNSKNVSNGGDDLSITSSSSSTCVNLINNPTCVVGDVTKEIDCQPQALTPTSNSSSASSGSGYGKVKRSNAFRAKDTSSVPTTPNGNNNPAKAAAANNDSRSKAKLVLERVKSLDTSSSGNQTGSSNCNNSDLSGSGSISHLNNNEKGIPAQRATSVCLRPSQSSSQIYVKTQSSSTAQVTKAVNIVTPYQVSDIYTQIRKGSLQSAQTGRNKPPQEVEYAVPIITRNNTQLRNNGLRQTPISPPKIPPPPQNYPPSAVGSKDQQQHHIGLPGSDSGYSFLQPKHLSYEEIGSSSQGQGQSQEIKMKMSTGGVDPNSSSESASCRSMNSTPSTKGLPPDKPPRTFLYDILTDHRQQTVMPQKQQRAAAHVTNNKSNNSSTNSNHELYMETMNKSVVVAGALTDGNNSNSFTATPSNRNANQSQTNNANNGGSNANPKRQYSSSSSSSTLTSSTTSYKQPQSGRGNISVSTATVRQTNKSSSNLLNKNQSQMMNNGDSNSSAADTTQKSKLATTIAASMSVFTAATVHANENPHSSNGANNNNNNIIVSKRGAELPVVYSIAPNHHPPLVRSKTESQLIVKSKSNWNYPNATSVDSESISGGNHHNPSTLTMSNYDYGYKTLANNANATPFHPSNANSTAAAAAATTTATIKGNRNSNNYYSPPHHHQSQNLLNNHRLYDGLPQYRSSTNLLKYNNRYPSNPGLYQSSSTTTTPWKDHEHGLPPANNNARYPHVYPSHNHHRHPHIHDHRSNSLIYMTDIDLEGLKRSRENKSAEGNNNNNNNNNSINNNHNDSVISKSVNVNRCSSDDRLCERSKSEWTLSHYHHQAQNANNSAVLAAPRSAIHAMGMMGTAAGRRNTVSVTSTTTTTGGGNSTGHPSLESTASSNVSSLTTQPHPNNSATNNNNNKRPGIQQSIQNLVNQLFSASSTIKDATSSTDSGIQLGSESLSSCDTPVGDSTTDTGDSDCENDGETINTARQVVEARKGYVRRVSSIRVQELGASLNRLIQNSKKPHSTEPLFECLLVVGLNRDPYTGVYHSYIRDKFPPNAKLPSGVEQFCFPDSLEWPCHEGTSAQFYTLAITDQRGSRKFGCCYRILPEGANICIPITYCVISSHRAIGFYREVLREITLRHGYSEYQKRFWMEELYKKQFPLTGGNITITEPTVEDLYQSQHHHQGHDSTVITNCYNNFSLSPTKTVSIKRRVDHRLDEIDLVTLLTTVDSGIVIKIFGSLLLERKVVVISRALSTLSLCVEALESMVYPFSWQHTFVPILPLNMTDVLDAPAPFLIGVLRSSQTPWDKTLDEGIVVDLDQNKIISCVGDEGTILPKRIHRKLRDALQLVLNLTDQKESTKNVLISECFIRMFVETMGHHAHHLVVQQDGMKIFERESFVKSCDSKAVQNFLEWFSETSMFHEFTQLRLRNTHQHGLFEQRVMEQYEQNQSQHAASGGTPLSFKNAKLFMNRTRPFGNWLKEAFVK
ncbi:uncharacterized protein DDB_G0283357 [Folsomia candida]|uniref:uncharacterized protein DDB_G0283357 n=1 Tax=Folsomia candida TaxID=158441 RepID=UPI000B8F1CBC|nr:uncharacterized protein DDB_G0283357 [Folsomia candida]